jgi:hypothetical protein
MSGDDLRKHLSTGLDSFVSRSYQRENPSQFETIDDLWLARGNIAHGKRSEYYRNGQRIRVELDKARDFITAAEHCIRWLEDIVIQ